jgi:putative transposase
MTSPGPKGNNPSGTGCQPVNSFQVTRRNLPYWQQPGSVYFITWRLKGETDLSGEERTMVLQALLHWDKRKWTIHAAVIMPDHVHVLAQPLLLPDDRSFNLSEIIRSVKTFSARTINARRGATGPLWQDERYDRIIRNEAEFLEKWQYLRNNPVARGLAATQEGYPWLYEKN